MSAADRIAAFRRADMGAGCGRRAAFRQGRSGGQGTTRCKTPQNQLSIKGSSGNCFGELPRRPFSMVRRGLGSKTCPKLSSKAEELSAAERFE